MALTWPTMDEGKWNLVASNVVIASIHRLKSNYAFWGTEVATGGAAPANTVAIRDKNPKLFEDGNTEKLEDPAPMDIYIWIEDAETDINATGITDAIRVNS